MIVSILFCQNVKKNLHYEEFVFIMDSSKCILIKKKHVHHAFKSLYASHFYVFLIKIINKNEHCGPCITDSNEISLKICHLTTEKQWNISIEILITKQTEIKAGMMKQLSLK